MANLNKSDVVDPSDFVSDITYLIQPYDTIDISSLTFHSFDDWHSTKNEIEIRLAYLDEQRVETQKKLFKNPGKLLIFSFLFRNRIHRLLTFYSFYI